MFHTESPLRWRPDGFRYLVTPVHPNNVPLSTLLWSYTLCLPAVIGAILEPAFAPALLSFLLPLPVALLSSTFSMSATTVDVDHRRVLVEGSLGRKRIIPLRDIRSVKVLTDGLEFVLVEERLRVKAPADGHTLWWLAERITEMCDEVNRFEADIGDRQTELARVIGVGRSLQSR